MNDFIQLNRRFSQLTQRAKNAPNDNADFEGELTPEYVFCNWEDLLKEYRTVILAEAGAGKTHEIRNITQMLRAEGKRAFFLRLEHVVSEFEHAFEIGTFQEFNSWLDSENEGWLFLDSVDEARLKNPKDFQMAIKKLSDKLSAACLRSHIVITSRVTAWRPKTDLNLCNEKFRIENEFLTVNENDIEPKKSSAVTVGFELKVKTEETKNSSDFKIWTIEDLTRTQIAVFVEAKGVRNSVQFLNEIEQQDAWLLLHALKIWKK